MIEFLIVDVTSSTDIVIERMALIRLEKTLGMGRGNTTKLTFNRNHIKSCHLFSKYMTKNEECAA